MSLSSSYTETCTLAAQVRCKFQGQYGTNKDENLRLIVAHAQLYDRLDHHLAILKKIRGFHSGGEQPFAPAVDVPNHQDPFRMNQQPDLQRSRPSSPRNPPWHPPKLAAESADENDEDPKLPSKPSDPACSVSIDEVEDLENPDHEDTTSEPHASPCLTGIPFTMVTNKSPCSTDYTSQTIISETFIEEPSDSDSNSDSDRESDCDIESSSSDYDGDLDPDDVTIHPQTIKATPAPMSKPNTPQPRIRWQDQESDKGLQLSDILPQDAPRIEDLPTLQRCSAPSSLSKPPKQGPRTEEADCTSNHNNGPRAAISVAAPRKTAPLAPLLSGDAADVAADQVHLEHGVLRKVHHRLADCQKDGEDASAITSSIAGKIPALAYWIFRGGKA
ncbi:MAG: hypothetical protein L6R36_003693 [Xanthoria steineri]|nr:MAG: hypothetical protein L6R36_003693 [Xanthoria steineri]